MANRPLADEIRPQTLDEMVGQRHILGENGILRRIIESGNIPNMVFYGPSGTGKTTVANIIARRTDRTLHRLNATTASINDIKEVIADVDTLMAPNGVLLYLDEIQYFNKKQQQSLLEFMENGKITLIASTTENPYFYVYNAVLSRSTVFEFKPVTAEEVRPAVERAVALLAKRRGVEIECPPEVTDHIAAACGGDVRKAVNSVELQVNAARSTGGRITLTLEDAQMLAQRSAMRYDRAGDDHFDIASALMKSMRGSDPDAALHYLARLLEAGDMVTAIRRILCSASEDVGMAYPQAVSIVNACVENANMLGLPEARLPLAQAVVLLATAPKSNSVYQGISAAMSDVAAGKTGDYPRHLQNVHADSAGMEREQGYLYPHDYPNHWVEQQYLPDALVGRKYYEFGENKQEQAARAYWERVKGEWEP
ncbi:MAG: replication-associated recombination protein A [Clostridiales bacterium]|nr:replication-associated recombination protein A [Clostridiales bacterium]